MTAENEAKLICVYQKMIEIKDKMENPKDKSKEFYDTLENLKGDVPDEHKPHIDHYVSGLINSKISLKRKIKTAEDYFTNICKLDYSVEDEKEMIEQLMKNIELPPESSLIEINEHNAQKAEEELKQFEKNHKGWQIATIQYGILKELEIEDPEQHYTSMVSDTLAPLDRVDTEKNILDMYLIATLNNDDLGSIIDAKEKSISPSEIVERDWGYHATNDIIKSNPNLLLMLLRLKLDYEEFTIEKDKDKKITWHK